MTASPTILYCHCTHGGPISADVREAVLTGLAASGAAFEPVADLCQLAARRDPLLARLAASAELHVIACFPRAVQWLFAYAGAPLAADAAIHNMRAQSADEVLHPLLARAGTKGGLQAALPSFPAAPADGWVAWYPVIDYDRCADCKQCLEFCLFGVYALADDGTVRVAAPDRCKLNCPACARVCPASAIVFPKFGEGGPIAGDEGVLTEPAEDGVRADFQRLAKADVMDVLRRRAARARAAASRKYPKEPPDR